MIAVAGGKGGSGKTTTTVGVARALARRGAPVVAADADWDLPNLAAVATEHAERSPTHPDLARTAIPSGAVGRVDRVATDGVPIPADRSEPTVLAAPERPRTVDPVTTFDALKQVTTTERPTLLDCPAGVAPDAVAPLRAADRSVLVTPLRKPALRDAAKTVAVARRLDCRPVGVIVTRARSVPDAIVDLLGCPVLGRIPPASPDPLLDSAVASAYDAAADRLIEEYGRGRWRVA